MLKFVISTSMIAGWQKMEKRRKGRRSRREEGDGDGEREREMEEGGSERLVAGEIGRQRWMDVPSRR